jgi:hypothetical protein
MRQVVRGGSVFVSVCSQLRSFAAHVVYVARPHVEGHRAVLQMGTAVKFLDLSAAAWSPVARGHVPVSILRVESPSGVGAARSLALRENQIFSEAKLQGQAYTLVLFPEQCEEREGRVFRAIPLAVVRGVHTPTAGKLAPVQGRVTRASFRPPGHAPGT